MATVRDLVTTSLRLLQEVGAGEVASAESAVDGLTALNRMLDSWSIDKDVIYTESRETFTLTGGTASYTIGSGGTFNVTKPLFLEQAFITNGGLTYEIAVNDAAQYALISDKTVAAMPSDVYFDGGYPLATMIFWPVPDSSYTLNLYSKKPLSNLSALTDTVNLPQGYERAIIYNLAVEIAPEYGKEASVSVQRTARSALRALESLNNSNDKHLLRTDLMLQEMNRNTYNIYGGQ